MPTIHVHAENFNKISVNIDLSKFTWSVSAAYRLYIFQKPTSLKYPQCKFSINIVIGRFILQLCQTYCYRKIHFAFRSIYKKGN